jgi:hypothetical protein
MSTRSLSEGWNSIDQFILDSDTRVGEVIDSLSSDPTSLVGELWEKLLSNDRHCTSLKSSERLRKTDLVCARCRYINQIGGDLDGKPFHVQCGSMVGTEMILSGKHISHQPHMRVDRSMNERVLSSIMADKRLLRCGTPPEFTRMVNRTDTPVESTCDIRPDVSHIVFLRCDTFTSSVLISWLMDCALQESRRVLTSFICKNKGHKLERRTHPIPDEVPREAVETIVRQIVYILKVLSPHTFCHGDPSPEHIRLEISGGTLKVHLDPGKYSSITTGNTRICSSPQLSTAHQTIFKPTMSESMSISTVTLYKIPHSTTTAFTTERMMGSPLYPGSFDLYCILVGLYCHPNFRECIDGIWSEIWLWDSDLTTLQSRVSNQNIPHPTYHDILKLIDGLWMRCDAVDRLSTSLDI